MIYIQTQIYARVWLSLPRPRAYLPVLIKEIEESKTERQSQFWQDEINVIEVTAAINMTRFQDRRVCHQNRCVSLVRPLKGMG